MLQFWTFVDAWSAKRIDRLEVRSSQRGASLVEYSLLVALIAVVCIGAVAFFGGELNSSLSTTGDSIN
jgi:pilus assembly protein Flp/PilA